MLIYVHTCYMCSIFVKCIIKSLHVIPRAACPWPSTATLLSPARCPLYDILHFSLHVVYCPPDIFRGQCCICSPCVPCIFCLFTAGASTTCVPGRVWCPRRSSSPESRGSPVYSYAVRHIRILPAVAVFHVRPVCAVHIFFI